jgi:hypothetical protein
VFCFILGVRKIMDACLDLYFGGEISALVKDYLFVDPCLWKTMSKNGFSSCGSELLEGHEYWVVHVKVTSQKPNVNFTTLQIYASFSPEGKIEMRWSKESLFKFFNWIMGDNDTSVEILFALGVVERYHVSYDEARKLVVSVMIRLANYFYRDILKKTNCICQKKSVKSKTCQ